MSAMGVKLGTKTFQENKGPSLAANIEPSVQTMSATEKDKAGAQNTGDIANKLADPNYIDPSKRVRTVGNDKLDKDAFFKLMIAQMKNQDPTNPLKSHEMAAQLANFSSLEQMQNMNKTLDEMKNGQKPMEQFQTLTLIGKAVAGDSAKLVRNVGDKEHDFKFNLASASAETVIKIRNEAGDTVRTYKMNNLKEGPNKLTWNGEDERGTKVPAGEYQFFVEAKNSNGQKMAVKTDFEGTITGVNYTPEGPVLLIGNQTIRLRDVRKIVDPSLKNNDQKTNNQNVQDLKKDAQMAQTEKEPASEQANAPMGAESKDTSGAPPAAKNKIMDSVGLARGMMAKLEKDMAPE